VTSPTKKDPNPVDDIDFSTEYFLQAELEIEIAIKNT